MFSQKSQEVHVVQEVVRVISDEEGMMMSNSPFYVDYFNREREKFQSGLLLQGFSLIVLHKCYRREMIGAVLMWEEFLGSNVDCYMKTSPQLFCADITRGEDSCNL